MLILALTISVVHVYLHNAPCCLWCQWTTRVSYCW